MSYKIIFLFISFFIISACNENTSKHDEAYLKKLVATYEELSSGNDMQKEIDAIDACIKEAALQKNIVEEDYARLQKLSCYCNYAKYEKLYAEVSIQADFFRQQKRWNNYYWTLQKEIEILCIENRYESALRKAKKLYQEAQKEKHPEGIGIATYCIGYIYHFTNRNEEAEIYLRKAIEPLQKTNNKSTLVNCFDKLAETLTTLKKYEASIAITTQYEQFLKELDKAAQQKNIVVDYSGLYHMCYYNYAYAYYHLKDVAKVEYYYKTMCENQGSSNGYISITQVVKRMLKRLNNDIPDFMASTDSIINEYRNMGNLFFTIELLDEKADVLIENNQFEEATHIYKNIISIKDSLNQQNLTTQLDDLRSIYELDHLIIEKEKNRLYAVIALSVCVFLLILLILYIRYSHRLKEKNRNLFNRIQELARMEKEQQRIEREEIKKLEEQKVTDIPHTPPTAPSREELLVKRLRVWLNTNNRFTHPDINRKQMADYLGTNEKYLADAIRNQCNGQTVSDFISNLRLAYARNLLIEQPEMIIDTIAEEAGLNTRISLFRLFKKHYGMSPSEFREAQKQGLQSKTSE